MHSFCIPQNSGLTDYGNKSENYQMWWKRIHESFIGLCQKWTIDETDGVRIDQVYNDSAKIIEVCSQMKFSGVKP